jgi:hypothetical protein
MPERDWLDPELSERMGDIAAELHDAGDLRADPCRFRSSPFVVETGPPTRAAEWVVIEEAPRPTWPSLFLSFHLC